MRAVPAALLRTSLSALSALNYPVSLKRRGLYVLYNPFAGQKVHWTFCFHRLTLGVALFYKILPCILPFGPAYGCSNFVPDKFVSQAALSQLPCLDNAHPACPDLHGWRKCKRFVGTNLACRMT